MQIITLDNLPAGLPTRQQDSHKGDFGAVGILGGAPGMVGATLLAARAALFCGAGRVYVGALDDRLIVDPVTPELMIVPAEAVLPLLSALVSPALVSPPPPSSSNCLVMGPGLGTSSQAHRILESALQINYALLLDADALNLLARDEALIALLRARCAATVLTPHPGEAARLLHTSTQSIQAARESAVQQLVALTNATVVLKGHATLIQQPGQITWCNSSGNAAMASAGMGDVLTGVIAALIAQGLSAEHAAALGVWLHGWAGDEAVAHNDLFCLTASEIIPLLRRGMGKIRK